MSGPWSPPKTPRTKEAEKFRQRQASLAGFPALGQAVSAASAATEEATVGRIGDGSQTSEALKKEPAAASSPQAEDHKSRVNEQLQRNANIEVAKKAADGEKVRRESIEGIARAHEQLERRSSIEKAKEAAEQEQERRVSLDKGALAREELQRVARITQAKDAVATEQKRRSVLDSSFRAKEELQRLANVSKAKSAVDKEQQRRVREADDVRQLNLRARAKSQEVAQRLYEEEARRRRDEEDEVSPERRASLKNIATDAATAALKAATPKSSAKASANSSREDASSRASPREAKEIDASKVAELKELATSFKAKGDYSVAASQFSMALTIMKDAQGKKWDAERLTIRKKQVQCYVAAKEFSDALKAISTALAIIFRMRKHETRFLHLSKFFFRYQEARIYALTAKYAKAIEKSKSLIKIISNFEKPSDWVCFFSRATYMQIETIWLFILTYSFDASLFHSLHIHTE